MIHVETPVIKKLKGGGVIVVRSEEYRLLHGGPKRVGDIDEIELLPATFAPWEPGRTFVRVMLREAEDGSQWLVQCGRIMRRYT